MPRKAKTNLADRGDAQGPFFQKQLAGEAGPSLETARHLCELGGEFYIQQPWRLLTDRDLILLQDPQSGEICYCSVMGAMGELFSVHVYIGSESYRFYRKVSDGIPVSAGEFFAAQHAVSVELTPASKAAPLDRQLLQAVGYPMRKGVPIPQFRAFRPGYHPWYITQAEAELLIYCLRAVLTFCSTLTPGDADRYWGEDDVYPFLSPVGNDGSRRDYAVKMVKASDPPPAPLPMPRLDPVQVEGVLRKNYAPCEAFEADHFVMRASVGEKNQRKACTRVALVTDAASGMLFPPELGSPQDSAGDILIRAILKASHAAQGVPKEVRVNDKNYSALLEPLAVCLGFSVRVTKSMPNLKLAKDSLFEMMGEPSPFAG